jgi:ribosomal 30S subunit maturation factor RimM
MSIPTRDHESCWTDEYLIAHCEGYRVDDEHGNRVGVVDSVLWPDEAFEDAEAVVLRQTGRQDEIVIPLGEIRDIDPWDERIVVPASTVRRAGARSRSPLAASLE